MRTYLRPALQLTDTAVMEMLNAAITCANDIGQPQCIVIVDASCVPLVQFRMDGAKVISLQSALAKARTAASIRAPSDAIPESVGLTVAAATGGDITRLSGGMPIVLDGHCVGGIGIGSGSPDQDKDVARAALVAIGAQTYE